MPNVYQSMEKSRLVFMKLNDGYGVYQVIKNAGYDETNIPEGTKYVSEDWVESSLRRYQLYVTVIDENMNLEETNVGSWAE